MTEEQHSSGKINRQHVVETSIEFLLRQVANQKLHVANLLAKTGDTDSYSYLQGVFEDVEACLEEIKEETLIEVKAYYAG
jgi:hypothetical protein